jgi:hypothetical protein
MLFAAILRNITAEYPSFPPALKSPLRLIPPPSCISFLRPMTRLTARLSLACALGVSTLASVHASGTYPPAPPRLNPALLKQIDPETYNLGKALFTGRATLPEQTALTPEDRTANERTLAALNLQLPDRVRTEANLPALAAKLTPAELAALRYYLGLRFRLADAGA